MVDQIDSSKKPVQRSLDAPVRRVDCVVFSHVKNRRGGLRRTLGQVVKRDLMVNNISEDLVFNQDEWCCVIHITDN